MEYYDIKIDRIKFKNTIKEPSVGMKVKLKTGNIGKVHDWDDEEISYEYRHIDDIDLQIKVMITFYKTLLISVDEKYPGEIGIMASGFFKSEEIEAI